MKLFLYSFTVLCLLLQLPAFSMAQGESPGDQTEPTQSKEILYYLYDLSTEDQATQLSDILDQITTVESYQIDIATHSVRLESATALKEGSPEWVAFTRPVRNAFKMNGFVRVKEEDLQRFYKQ